MADFMFLFRGGESLSSPAEMQASMRKWQTWVDDLRRRGHFKAGDPLDARVGKVVRGRKKVVTDGPFAEAKDLVGGYFIVSAKDIEQATELSLGCPIFELDGTVEVRVMLAM